MSQNSVAENPSKKSGFLGLATIRDIVVVLFLIILSWKLINSDFGFTIETLSLTDIIFLLIALFSIGLSVAFYFKASDTSNQFYQQTHTFTKETSELLGRVESGLVERLGSLDKNYSTMTEGMFSSFRNGYSLQGGQDPISEGSKDELGDQIKQKESEILEMKEAHQAVVEALMNKAQLNEQEKNETRDQLDKKEQELRSLDRELRKVKEEHGQFITAAELSSLRQRKISHVISYLVHIIRSHSEKSRSWRKMNILQARIGFRDALDYLPPEAIQDMQALGLLEGKTLSREAAAMVAEAWSK